PRLARGANVQRQVARRARLRAIGRKSQRSTSSQVTVFGCSKLLNIGAIGFTLVQSEKAGEHPSTRQTPLPHYRAAPPILKKVAKTKSLRRPKELSTNALPRGHRSPDLQASPAR